MFLKILLTTFCNLTTGQHLKITIPTSQTFKVISNKSLHTDLEKYMLNLKVVVRIFSVRGVFIIAKRYI